MVVLKLQRFNTLAPLLLNLPATETSLLSSPRCSATLPREPLTTSVCIIPSVERTGHKLGGRSALASYEITCGVSPPQSAQRQTKTTEVRLLGLLALPRADAAVFFSPVISDFSLPSEQIPCLCRCFVRSPQRCQSKRSTSARCPEG